MPKQPTPSRHKHPLWLKLLIVILAIVAISGVSVSIAEFNFQKRVNALWNIVNQVGQDAVEPAGGIKVASGGMGTHVWSMCIDNGPCPSVSTVWLVLGDQSSRDDLTKMALKTLASQGYTLAPTGGHKGNVIVGFNPGARFPDRKVVG
jgi:hypothetical protein